MSKQRPKMLYFGPLDVPAFGITAPAWIKLGRAYGRRIPAHTRTQISEATASYLTHTLMERASPSIADVMSEMQKMERAATTIINQLDPKRSAKSETLRYVQHLVINYVHHPSLPSLTNIGKGDTPQNPLKALSDLLKAIPKGLESARLRLSDPDWTMRRTDSWEIWIKKIRTALAEAGLPHTVRKDDGPKMSPFVGLIEGLQQLLPDDVRQHQGSSMVLAQAISRVK